MRPLTAVESRPGSPAAEPQPSLIGRSGASNAVLQPVGMVTALGLGLALLDTLSPHGFAAWLQLGAGASLWLVAGWLASSIWSRSYWNRSMARQVAVWRRITDAWFTWVENLQVSTEDLNELKVSLEEAVPNETV